MGTPNDQLQGILDDCLQHYLQGESVEACAQRYPAFASAIRLYLAVAERFRAVLDYTPTPEAKERGRQRLLAELAALRDKGSLRGNSAIQHPGIIQSGLLAAAAACLALVLAVSGLLPGVGDVSWLGGPGKTPVETPASPLDLVQYHLREAESHAGTVAQLLVEGHGEEAFELAQRIANEVATSVASGILLAHSELLPELRRELRRSASLVLGRLEEALSAAPTPGRDAASAALRLAAEAYGRAFESTALAAAPVPSDVSAPIYLEVASYGRLDLADDERIVLTINTIEARSAGPDEAWQVVWSTPVTLRLSGGESAASLIEASLPTGQYTRLRIGLDGAALVTNEGETPLSVPTWIEAVRPFSVAESTGASLSLDLGLSLDGGASTHSIAGTPMLLVAKS